MNFLIKGFPIHAHWNPSEGVDGVENCKSSLPVHHEWVDEKEVPGERHESHLCAIWVFQVDSTVLDVIAAPQKHLTFTVEFEGLRWLIHFISSF